MILHIGKGDSIAINSVKFYQRNDRIILTSYGKVVILPATSCHYTRDYTDLAIWLKYIG